MRARDDGRVSLQDEARPRLREEPYREHLHRSDAELAADGALLLVEIAPDPRHFVEDGEAPREEERAPRA